MCGISALVERVPSDRLSREIVAMTSIIAHRGPDGEGFVSFDESNATTQLDGRRAQVSLGHRRLAIVDLSPTGHQPMATGCERYWITYNGEIYNAQELRQELITLGHRFKGTSDTEVILYAYKEWGADCLRRFNGMFAFVLYDKSSRYLFVARDRFGIKPLYIWRRSDGAFAFASEIKQFTKLEGWKASLNRQMAYDFLVWEAMDHTDATLFSGVSQLRGGQYLEMQLGRAPSIVTWYDFPTTRFSGSFDEAAEIFRELLDDSVRLRLRADVAVGSCLSGGLDSSAIVCLASRLLQKSEVQVQQSTFSACSHYPQYDERRYMEKVVESTSVNPHYTYPSYDSLLETSKKLVWYQDEPFLSTSIYAQWEVFALASKQQVKVMLDGQGADEHLAGYSNFLGIRAYELLKEKPSSFFRQTRPRQWLQLLDLVLPELVRQPLRRLMGKASAKPKWWTGKGVECRDPFRADRATTIEQLSRLQLTKSNLPKLLHWEDRDSMAHSIEARTPFLDHRLVEFACSLPSSFKLENGLSKRVLRSGLSGVVPPEILDRRDKMGFVTPEQIWLEKDGRKDLLAAAKETIERAKGCLSPHLLSHCEKIADGRIPFSSLPWRVVSFGQWMDCFSVDD
jgi:asparagine synthase (glutamine-hydrolysing)